MRKSIEHSESIARIIQELKIKMNIFGKYIDDNQQVLKSLTKIYGIGRPTAKELCMTFGVGLDRKVKDLSKDTWSILIKAAELGPFKYKDLVKELQESTRSQLKEGKGSAGQDSLTNGVGSASTDYGYFSVAKSMSPRQDLELSLAPIQSQDKDKSTDPLVDAIKSFISNKARLTDTGMSMDSAGKLRSQKVEGRALTDLREGLEAEKKMKSYKGLRHLEGLPVRGQRTSTNALTARKRKK